MMYLSSATHCLVLTNREHFRWGFPSFKVTISLVDWNIRAEIGTFHNTYNPRGVVVDNTFSINILFFISPLRLPLTPVELMTIDIEFVIVELITLVCAPYLLSLYSKSWLSFLPSVKHPIERFLFIFYAVVINYRQQVTRELWIRSLVFLPHHCILIFRAHIRLIEHLWLLLHVLISQKPLWVVILIWLRAPAPGILRFTLVLPNQVVYKLATIWICFFFPSVHSWLLRLDIVHLLHILTILLFGLFFRLFGPINLKDIVLPKDLLLIDQKVRDGSIQIIDP